MEMFVVAVRDVAVSAYMQPSFVHHTAAAVREFADHCKNPESPFSKHPEDFELWLLAQYEDIHGAFVPPDAGNGHLKPIRLCRALDHVSPGQPTLAVSNT